ncbi:MAG: xanthine dehydrogenase family protein molybdopterin-binding subunit [Acidobacteria bacterium]|nr:xanthine dehydrogenase family protein molybdopterin-binding subunit [Acidobacteriota bacterium]
MSERVTRREAMGVALLTLAAGPVRVRVGPDGTVTAYTAKVELGQGALTELTMAVAEELRVPVSRVRLVMGDTGQCPDDGGTWASLTTPEAVPLLRQAAAEQRGGAVTPARQWRVMGTAVKDLRGQAVVTGGQPYPSGLRMEGMLYGHVLRAPHYRARLVKAGAAPEGVRLLRDGEICGVVSSDPVAAKRAAGSVACEWEAIPFSVAPSDREALKSSFKATAVAPVENMSARYPPLLRRGRLDDAREHERQASSYFLPFITHVPLEPRAALAVWRGESVEIRSGCQAPFAVRAEVARALGIAEGNVRIQALGPGGAFGCKQRGEVETEAARLARLAGAPVLVQWSREEEFTCAYHRPAALVEIESTVSEGRLTGWLHKNFNAGAPGLMTPYDTPNISCEFHRTAVPVRQGSYRSLAAVANTFARESHVDEWAARLKADPLEFRMRNLADERLKAVLERLRGVRGGLACTIEKQARIGLRAEVEVKGVAVRVKRLVYVGDYGAIVNPLNLRKQIEGALVQGLGGALFEEVLFAGTEQKSRWMSGYRVPRFSDTPEIVVELIDRRAIASAGAGEAAIILVAPAIANAVFAASGRRLRDLPLAR